MDTHTLFQFYSVLFSQLAPYCNAHLSILFSFATCSNAFFLSPCRYVFQHANFSVITPITTLSFGFSFSLTTWFSHFSSATFIGIHYFPQSVGQIWLHLIIIWFYYPDSYDALALWFSSPLSNSDWSLKSPILMLQSISVCYNWSYSSMLHIRLWFQVL